MAACDTSDRQRLSAHFRCAAALPAVYRRLHACGSVGEVFAQAAEMARSACTFDRGVILSLEGGYLTAGDSDALRDDASDRLRRRVLRDPIELAATASPPTSRFARCEPQLDVSLGCVADALELEHWAAGVIASQERSLAVLVLDRAGLPVDDLDRAAVEGFAAVAAAALESVVLRTRIARLARQMRHITTFAQALAAEMLTAPVDLALPPGQLTEFPSRTSPAPQPVGRDRLRELFTDREREIAALLVEGRSNRDIAARLYLSPETVKMHVAHILRKLDVTNRVEAATRLLAITQAAGEAPRWTSPDLTLARVYGPTRSGVAVEVSHG
jgi:DNA-binding CsgD family transcriptional regulator